MLAAFRQHTEGQCLSASPRLFRRDAVDEHAREIRDLRQPAAVLLALDLDPGAAVSACTTSTMVAIARAPPDLSSDGTRPRRDEGLLEDADRRRRALPARMAYVSRGSAHR